MPTTENLTVGTAPVAPGEPSWPALARQWLPAWLDACDYPQAAEELRSCPQPRLRRLVDRLFVGMQDELMTAMDTHIPLADELCEPIAVAVGTEYIEASLPGPWLLLVRGGATAGRVGLVAQMALFVQLLAMAAEPDPDDAKRLMAACSRAEQTLTIGAGNGVTVDVG